VRCETYTFRPTSDTANDMGRREKDLYSTGSPTSDTVNDMGQREEGTKRRRLIPYGESDI
jgi:hypothetical protein